jgi:hypothetical protein
MSDFSISSREEQRRQSQNRGQRSATGCEWVRDRCAPFLCTQTFSSFEPHVAEHYFIVLSIEEFCTDPEYTKYCDAGQIRALYVNETESNGPTTARYFASKLWGGETYFMQASNLLISQNNQ